MSLLRARIVAPEDFERFDLILAMDREQSRGAAAACAAAARERVRLFLDFAPEQGTAEVPDPYYGGAAGFEQVLDLVEAASRGLIVHCGRGREPPEATRARILTLPDHRYRQGRRGPTTDGRF